MADIHAIERLLYRLAYGNDERDIDILAGCFTEDATMGGMTRKQQEEGYSVEPTASREKILRVFSKGWPRMTGRRRHMITNVWIEEDGERQATVNSYVTLFIIRDETLTPVQTLRYRDEVVIDDDGQWKIRNRFALHDLTYNPGDVSRNTAVAPTGDRHE